MKKFLAFIMAAAIAASTLSACGQPKTEPETPAEAVETENPMTTAPEETEPETTTLPVIVEDISADPNLIFDTPSFILVSEGLDKGDNGDWFRAVIDPWSGNDVTGDKFIEEAHRELAKGESRVRVTLTFGSNDFTDEAFFDIGVQDTEDGNYSNFGQIRSDDVVMTEDSVTFSVSGQALLELMEQRGIKKEFGQIYMQIGGLTDEANNSACDAKAEVLVGREPETRLEADGEKLFSYYAIPAAADGNPTTVTNGSYYGYVLHPDDQPNDYPIYEEAIKTPGAVLRFSTNIPGDCITADTKAAAVLGQYWRPDITVEVPADVIYANDEGYLTYEISCDRFYSAYKGLGFLPVGYLYLKLDGIGEAAEGQDFTSRIEIINQPSENLPELPAVTEAATEPAPETTAAAETEPATATAAETKPVTTTAAATTAKPATTTAATTAKPAETTVATEAGPLKEVPVKSGRAYDTSTFVSVIDGLGRGDYEWFDALVDPWSENDVTGEKFNTAFFRALGDGDCTVKVTLSFGKSSFKEGEAWFDIGIQDTEDLNYNNFEQIRTKNAKSTSSRTVFSVSGKDLLNIRKKLNIKEEYAQVYMQIGGLTDEANDSTCTARIEVIPGREREKRFSGDKVQFSYTLHSQKVKNGEHYRPALHPDDQPEEYSEFEKAMQISGAVLRVNTHIPAEYLTLDTEASVVMSQYFDPNEAVVVPSDVIYADDDGNICYEISCDRLYSAYYGFSYLPVGYVYLRLTDLDPAADSIEPVDVEMQVVTK